MLETFTLQTFEPLVGSAFTLMAPEGATAAFTLTSATALPAAPGAPREPFSLIFDGPADPPPPQSTYEVSHPQLGQFALFLVPLAIDAQGARLEAIFA